MNNRERIRNCLQKKEVDRAPLVLYFGPWAETVERWKKECGESLDLNDMYEEYDPGIVSINDYVYAGPYPKFEQEILEKDGDRIVYRTENGSVMCSIEGKSGIPQILSNPVTNWEEWERYKKERLNPDDPERFPENWDEIAKMLNASEKAVQAGAYPYGLFGTARDLMGTENLLMNFYDEPELIRDMMDYLTDFWIKIYRKAAEKVHFDVLHIWEDMSGKHGPLISPAMIREFMVPNYRRFTEFAKETGMAGTFVDTDGDCDLLIPPFMEGGIDMILPFEVAAGSDIIRIREKYPELVIFGGIDKRKIAGSPEEIDRELERIRPLLGGSGYFPALDHLIPPEVSWENFRYYSHKLRRMAEDAVI